MNQIWRENKLNGCFKTWRARHENQGWEKKEGETEKIVGAKP